ncbi:MAG TPA: FecR family protein [Rhodocyclaceae bacterium]|nr:FecR family protein [Rhodocyclaceae bacterium]HNH34368.1 FecR family protein [Rhodocyclaceae bacterium]
MPNEFKLKDSARLAAAVTAAFPFATYGAGAGKVDFAVGNVAATATDGRTRALTKGSEINPGETIDTRDGRAQVRFTDGSQVALQPQTQFRIDDYNFAGRADGSEKSFFSLLKGGLRTITGLIGKGDRNNYKVTTQVATIGIRGTEWSATMGEVLNISTGEGAIEVCNSAGCMILNAGESGTVTSSSSSPARTQSRSSLPPPQPVGSVKPVFTAAEAAQASLPSGPGYAFAAAFEIFGSATMDSGTGVGTFTPGTGQLNKFVIDGGEFGSPRTFTAQTHVGTFTDGIIGWGRIATGMLDGPEGGSVSNVHYVVGQPTPSSDIASLHSRNMTGTYELMGFTLPTSTSGAVGGRVTGSMTANFGTLHLGWTLGVPIGGHNFGIAGSAGFGASPGFSGAVSCTSGCCTGGSFSGFFAGANAVRAGLVYKFSSGTDLGTVSGAAAFRQTGLTEGAEVALGRLRR